MNPRAILHVDMDAFYASVEQLDDPSLRGKPVIVGGTGARGVVAAASYEVRKFGVRSAMPMARALQLCPHASCVRPRFDRYKAVSAQIFEIFRSITPLVEGLSLDEAFLDVSASRTLLGDEVSIARDIKERIRRVTGVTASIGVAGNKLVAKIASDLDKPDGLTVLFGEDVMRRLDVLPVQRLPGLGRKLGDKVEAAGVRTLGELRRAPDATLRPLFGKDLQRMRERASGIDDRAVVPDRDEKSISAEETFDTDVADTKKLQAELLTLADRVGTRLRKARLLTRCIGVKIRRSDFSTLTRQRRIDPPTDDGQTIASVASSLLAAWLREEGPTKLRLLGVQTSELAPAEQMDLFEAVAAPGAQRLDRAVDEIRAKFGGEAVVRGSRLKP